MTKTRKAKKSPVDAALDDAFRKFGNGVQFDIMDFNPMFKDAREAVHTAIANSPVAASVLATDGIIPQSIINDAMSGAIAKYRKN